MITTTAPRIAYATKGTSTHSEKKRRARNNITTKETSRSLQPKTHRMVQTDLSQLKAQRTSRFKKQMNGKSTPRQNRRLPPLLPTSAPLPRMSSSTSYLPQLVSPVNFYLEDIPMPLFDVIPVDDTLMHLDSDRITWNGMEPVPDSYQELSDWNMSSDDDFSDAASTTSGGSEDTFMSDDVEMSDADYESALAEICLRMQWKCTLC